jgi:hypothetical protein
MNTQKKRNTKKKGKAKRRAYNIAFVGLSDRRTIGLSDYRSDPHFPHEIFVRRAGSDLVSFVSLFHEVLETFAASRITLFLQSTTKR